MAAAKEIRTKIRSIKNTQKITRAMEMVAASKMRKAQERMQRAQPYAKKILQVISHLAAGHPEYRHPFLRAISKRGFIIITTDRGLCGGLNTNLLKTAFGQLDWKENADISLCLVRQSGKLFLTHRR